MDEELDCKPVVTPTCKIEPDPFEPLEAKPNVNDPEIEHLGIKVEVVKVENLKEEEEEEEEDVDNTADCAHIPNVMAIKEEHEEDGYDEALMGPVEDFEGEEDKVDPTDTGDRSSKRKRGTEDVEETPAKKRASGSHTSGKVTPERAPHLLPIQCVICKRDKYRTERWSGKRLKEKLMLCQTPYAGKLLRAAEEKQDEALLVDIRDKDLVAIEVRYHFTCYRNYVRFLYQDKNKTKKSNVFNNGYKYFCETVVEEKLFKNREVLRLSQLTMLFKDIVQDREGVSIAAYTSQALKLRLQKSHPSLQFQKASRTYSVFVEDFTAKETLTEGATSPSSSSDRKGETAVTSQVGLDNASITPGTNHDCATSL